MMRGMAVPTTFCESAASRKTTSRPIRVMRFSWSVKCGIVS